MCKHNWLRTFICRPSGLVQNSLACSQNIKYWIIHNCLISNRLRTGCRRRSISRTFLTSLSLWLSPVQRQSHTQWEIKRYYSQHRREQLQVLLFFKNFFFSPIKRTKNLYFLFWTATVALAITNKVARERGTKGNCHSGGNNNVTVHPTHSSEPRLLQCCWTSKNRSICPECLSNCCLCLSAIPTSVRNNSPLSLRGGERKPLTLQWLCNHVACRTQSRGFTALFQPLLLTICTSNKSFCWYTNLHRYW